MTFYTNNASARIARIRRANALLYRVVAAAAAITAISASRPTSTPKSCLWSRTAARGTPN